MNDKQRAEFEKWARQYEYDLTWSDAIDCYAIMHTRFVFDAWQAAIASVVVELPELEKHDRDAVTEKLEDAGIRHE